MGQAYVTLIFGLVLFSLVMIVSGITVPRVVNGRRTDTVAVPYVAQLVTRNNGQVVCGASIIDHNWAVTAAHCLGKGKYTYALDVNKGQTTEGRIRVEDAVIHPRFDRNFSRIKGADANDIALLKLAPNDVITEENFIKVVPSDVGELVGANCSMAGWGRTQPGLFVPPLKQRWYASHLRNMMLGPEQLQRLKQMLLRRKTRGSMSTSLRETSGVIQPRACSMSYGSSLFRENSHLCFHHSRSGGCKGDSGGPLICNGYLAGVTSLVERACSPLVPTIFTRVSKYSEWIGSVTGIHIGSAEETAA